VTGRILGIAAIVQALSAGIIAWFTIKLAAATKQYCPVGEARA